MFGFGVFRRKPRQFDYRPRYYDPEKEAREERRRELFGEAVNSGSGENYVPGQYIRRDMLYKRGLGSAGGRRKRLSVPMAVAVLIILGLAVYWVLS